MRSESTIATTLRDLVDLRVEHVTVTCAKCERTQNHGLGGLLVRHGMSKRLDALLADLLGDCTRRTGQGRGLCGAMFRVGAE
jgi:hypothetical protein